MLKNIEQLPSSIQKGVTRFAEGVLAALGSNVLSLTVYGSSAGQHFVAKASDVNILILVDRMDFESMTKISGQLKQAAADKISAPLVMTKQYVLDSADVFPIEFLDIQKQHIVIFGEDFFGSLNIDRRNIRLFCEQQIKGKFIRLTQAYMQVFSHPDAAKVLLGDSLNTLIPVFRHLLILKNEQPAQNKAEVLRQLGTAFAVDTQTLLSIYQIRNKEKSLPSDQFSILFKNYLQVLEQLANGVNNI